MKYSLKQKDEIVKMKTEIHERENQKNKEKSLKTKAVY